MRYQTSDYPDFDTVVALVRKLYHDEKHELSLMIGCEIFFRLRTSDFLSPKWESLFIEGGQAQDHQNQRPVQTSHPGLCYEAIHPSSLDRPCFISQKHGVYSVQRMNILLKDIKKKYNLKIKHFSTHSLRKTFGRRSSSWRLPRDRANLRSSSSLNSSITPTPASPESTLASKRERC